MFYVLKAISLLFKIKRVTLHSLSPGEANMVVLAAASQASSVRDSNSVKESVNVEWSVIEVSVQLERVKKSPLRGAIFPLRVTN